MTFHGKMSMPDSQRYPLNCICMNFTTYFFQLVSLQKWLAHFYWGKHIGIMRIKQFERFKGGLLWILQCYLCKEGHCKLHLQTLSYFFFCFSWRALRSPWKKNLKKMKKFQTKIESWVHVHNTFQPIQFSRLVGYREHI